MFSISTTEKLFESSPLGSLITRCKICLHPNLLLDCLYSNNAKGTVPGKTESQFGMIKFSIS